MHRSEQDNGALRVPGREHSTGILVVDDDSVLLRLSEDVLKEAGYRVLVAWSGAEALRTLDQRADEIQMMIVDHRMGDMSGVDVVRKVRARWPHVACLMVTGFAVADVLDEMADEEVMEKPYSIPELLARVRTLLAMQPG